MLAITLSCLTLLAHDGADDHSHEEKTLGEKVDENAEKAIDTTKKIMKKVDAAIKDTVQNTKLKKSKKKSKKDSKDNEEKSE